MREQITKARFNSFLLEATGMKRSSLDLINSGVFRLQLGSPSTPFRYGDRKSRSGERERTRRTKPKIGHEKEKENGNRTKYETNVKIQPKTCYVIMTRREESLVAGKGTQIESKSRDELLCKC